MKLKILPILIFIVAALLFTQCASEGAPGGGPPDKTPPALIDVSVQSGSIKVPADQEISFYFSENINPDNIDKSVTIFPLGNEPVQIRSRGRSLTIRPATQWDPKVVYTLILGKGVSDMRGNSLKQPIQISFTSGEQIPENMISGRVAGLRSGTTAVIAISRKHANPDSILLSPEYYTQTGPEGDFQFAYLPAEPFYIAGYIDLDESNSFKAKFDGACVPGTNELIPDTLGAPLLIQAVYDNYLPGYLIRAEAIDPMKTDLTFSKAPAIWNSPRDFMVANMPVDTIMFKDKTCTIYHEGILTDTFDIEISGLTDQVGMSIADSILQLPAVEWPDSFFQIEQIDHLLRIVPDPDMPLIGATLQTANDTAEIELTRIFNGFYELPQIKTARKGTCLLPLQFLNTQSDSDSLYSVKVSIAALPEFGAVLGTLDMPIGQNVNLVLQNDGKQYEILSGTGDFVFDSVLPGSYSLWYYIDANGNGRRDLGRPHPHLRPEMLHALDSGIDVRARWDTDLETPYKIVVEIEK